MYMYLCIKFFDVNNRAKLKTCLQPGSQNKDYLNELQACVSCDQMLPCDKSSCFSSLWCLVVDDNQSDEERYKEDLLQV